MATGVPVHPLRLYLFAALVSLLGVLLVLGWLSVLPLRNQWDGISLIFFSSAIWLGGTIVIKDLLGKLLTRFGIQIKPMPEITLPADSRVKRILERHFTPSLRNLLRTLGVFFLMQWVGTCMPSGISDYGATIRGTYLVLALWSIVFLSLLLVPWIRSRIFVTLPLAVCGTLFMVMVGAIVGTRYLPTPEYVAMKEIRPVRDALDRYRNVVADHRYPASLQQLAQDPAAGWADPQLAALNSEGWANRYQYESDGADYTLQATFRSEHRRFRMIVQHNFTRIIPADTEPE